MLNLAKLVTVNTDRRLKFRRLGLRKFERGWEEGAWENQASSSLGIKFGGQLTAVSF